MKKALGVAKESRITRKVQRNPISQLTLIPGLSLGVPFVGAGCAIIALSLGWIDYDTEKIHAPPWVYLLGGVLFLLPGLLCWFFGIRNGLRGRHENVSCSVWTDPSTIVAGLVLVVLGVIAMYTGFGEGQREFSGDASSGTAHLLFGILGAVCMLCAIGILYRVIREIRSN
jgi:hypothetical protein